MRAGGWLLSPSVLIASFVAEATPERLTHAGIRDIAAVAWRPNAKSVLAVAHAGGICLWTCDTNPQPAARAGTWLGGVLAPSPPSF